MASEPEEEIHTGYCIHCEGRDGVEHEEPCTYIEPCGTCCADGMGPAPHLYLRNAPVLSLFR